MSKTLEQLLETQSKEDLFAQLLIAMQGVGFVRRTGIGSGGVSAFGVAAGAYEISLKIAAAGEMGVATFQLSVDGGVNYGAPITVPANGIYVVPSTGATVRFFAGPTGSGNSFEVGDAFAFTLSTPTFPTAAWQPGSTPRTLLELYSQVLENFSTAVRNVASGGLLRTATGAWMDLLLPSLYKLTRRLPGATVGTIILTDTASSGPHTITAGQVWVATAGGLRYNNLAGGVLPLSGSLSLSYRAESPGSVYNVAALAITQLLTALPGVTVSNPNPIGGDWITTGGTDRETDAEAVIRAESRWPSLGIGVPKDTYDLWAKTADPSVTRTHVRASPTVPGQIDVFLADAAGGVSPGVIANVQAFVNPRAALTSVPVVVSATVNSYTVQGTYYVAAGFEALAAAAISQNLVALNGGGFNSIGELLPGLLLSGGTLFLTQIIEQIQLAPGVRNVVLTLPAADVALVAGEVGVLTQALTPSLI